jgi:hypothetical protein
LPYNRGNQGERWGRGVFQHIQTDAFTTPVHCIDRIAYEGVVTKHSGGDGLEVTHSLVGSQNPASQINELRPSVTVTRTSPSPTSRLGLSVIPTRKAIHQSDVVNRPYDMTESTLSVQIFICFFESQRFICLFPRGAGMKWLNKKRLHRGAALQSELVHSSTRPTYKMKTTSADWYCRPRGF